MNEPMLKTELAAIGSAEFFDRARARLRFDIPAGLTDASVVPPSGDQGTDRMLKIIAQERPIGHWIATVENDMGAAEHSFLSLSCRRCACTYCPW